MNKKDNQQKEASTAYRTPSQMPYPVFVVCPPMYVDTKIKNNIWMKTNKGKDVEIDKEQFMGEWLRFYQLLASNSYVLSLPAKRGLQDQTYVNCFVYLPHIKDRDIIVLSNFTAEGRAGEEVVAGDMLSKLGYKCIKAPFKFEGEPELKYLRDDIYFGGYGFRSDARTHSWIEKTFHCRVIKIKEHDEFCYHLDCNLFVLNDQNVMCCTSAVDKSAVKEIEKVANVFPVTKEDCYEDICNIVRVGDLIICASGIQFMKSTDPLYNLQKKKNEKLQKIANGLGLEVIFLQMDENAKSGAATSCLVGTLNRDY